MLEVSPTASPPNGRVAFFLRGINLGGRNVVRMETLRQIAADLGATDATTHLASGNLICTPAGEPATFADRVQQAVRQTCGVDSPVLFREPTRLAHICAIDPPDGAVEDPSRHIVMLLRHEIAPQDDADFPRSPGELMVVDAREIHLWYADGTHGATLSHAFLERALRMTVTARNIRTMRAVYDRAVPDHS